MKVLLLAIGSHGDVHPFVGIGKRLTQRGHEVTVAANEMFGPLIERVGLTFVELGTEEEFRRIASDPAMWGRMRSFHAVMNGVLPGVKPMYEAVIQFMREGDGVVAGSSLALGMRIAEEKLGRPMALVHLAPAIVRSLHETPMLPGSPLRPWMPRWMKGPMYGLIDWVVDSVMKKPIEAIRNEAGLGPMRGHVWDWWNDAAMIVGMWPEWFARPQADWPMQTRLSGFGLYDEKDVTPMGDELKRFLDAGEAPVAFTAGSAMWSEHHFFEESAMACEAAGCRGLLLTKHREMVPEKLPGNVMHVAYAPFSDLLPRCAAVVHHGGIGTTSQALASGTPQIVMPFAHDQLDNANRVVKLGCGKWVEPKAYRAKRVAGVIGEILGDAVMGTRCDQVKRRFAGEDGVARACESIEALAKS